MQKKLYKSSTDKQLMGVCGGLAEYFGIDTTIVRIIFLVMIFAGSSGFWLYVILGLVLPYDYQVADNHVHYQSDDSRFNNRRDITPEDEDNWDNF